MMPWPVSSQLYLLINQLYLFREKIFPRHAAPRCHASRDAWPTAPMPATRRGKIHNPRAPRGQGPIDFHEDGFILSLEENTIA
jgi:hypothetical protein